MYLSMIEFSMTLKFVIKDGFEKNFQKKKKIAITLGRVLWVLWFKSLSLKIIEHIVNFSLLHFAYKEKELN